MKATKYFISLFRAENEATGKAKGLSKDQIETNTDNAALQFAVLLVVMAIAVTAAQIYKFIA